MSVITEPRFALGQIVATTNAMQVLTNGEVQMALRSHASGDWGELEEEDRRENDVSLERGWRLLSIYRCKSGVKFWIITEADRSATTVLLPSDY